MQPVFVTGNRGFTAAETVEHQAQFTGQERPPGGLPGRAWLQRRLQRRLEMLAQRGWRRMDIGNPHTHHGGGPAQGFRAGSRAGQGLQRTRGGLRLPQGTVS